jgi:hypothetical protein
MKRRQFLELVGKAGGAGAAHDVITALHARASSA